MAEGFSGEAMRSEKGFTLIELLIVVAILGVISALAIAALTNALDKGKQKRTMMDLHTIAEATETYGVDHATYPAGVSDWATLRLLISPFFIRQPPDADGWAHSWTALTDAGGNAYSLVSLGKDGLQGTWSGGMTDRFDCDIVFASGQFFQWPQGTQH
jgi:type II secretion system protein G